MIKRALVSVSDKQGIVPFCRHLSEFGVEIISTGGTLQTLIEAGVPAQSVSDVTGFPEMMDGRVKTLHPMIHGGILAVRNNEEHIRAMETHDIRGIDLVVVNLYPFSETIAKPNVQLAEAIENIDIGGPAMVRSAAKNFAYVGVVVNPLRYDEIIEDMKRNGGALSATLRMSLAQEAFAHTASYDAAIANYFADQVEGDPFPESFILPYKKIQDLRYGENPHQKAAFYKNAGKAEGLGALKQLHGKELSYNNIVDMDAAWNMVWEFREEPACCIIKHTNPCGAATGRSSAEAFAKAFEADTKSAFGGIVACNREIDEEAALAMKGIFLEVVMAPSFTPDALAVWDTAKNIRLVQLAPPIFDGLAIKKVSGGLLVQEEDSIVEDETLYEVVTDSKPTEAEWKGLYFAWKLVKHVKSNAILIASGEQTVGVGAGQMNRVGAADIALAQAGEKAVGAVLASDAFFPFGDTVETAAKHGIRAIIQPGGSIRDDESIANANKAGIAMVFTHTRHFKHG